MGPHRGFHVSNGTDRKLFHYQSHRSARKFTFYLFIEGSWMKVVASLQDLAGTMIARRYQQPPTPSISSSTIILQSSFARHRFQQSKTGKFIFKRLLPLNCFDASSHNYICFLVFFFLLTVLNHDLLQWRVRGQGFQSRDLSLFSFFFYQKEGSWWELLRLMILMVDDLGFAQWT